MSRLREFVELGHRLRDEGGVKTRQPLKEAILVLPEESWRNLEPLLPLLQSELNVKSVRRAPSKDPFLARTFHLPLAKLGPKFRGDAKVIAETVEHISPDRLAANIDARKPVNIEYGNPRKMVEIPAEWFEVRAEPKKNFAAGDLGKEALVLNLELNEELKSEGFAREVIRAVQRTRKEAGLKVEDSIELRLEMDEAGWKMLEKHLHWVAEETQAKNIARGAGPGAREWDLDGVKVRVSVAKA